MSAVFARKYVAGLIISQSIYMPSNGGLEHQCYSDTLTSHFVCGTPSLFSADIRHMKIYLRLLPLSLLTASVVLFITSYLCAYKSGCLFDGKQGYGDLQASEPYAAAALFSFFSAIILLSIGYAAYRHLPRNQFVLLLIIAVIIGMPIFGFLSFEAAIHGAQHCQPA